MRAYLYFFILFILPEELAHGLTQNVPTGYYLSTYKIRVTEVSHRQNPLVPSAPHIPHTPYPLPLNIS